MTNTQINGAAEAASIMTASEAAHALGLKQLRYDQFKAYGLRVVKEVQIGRNVMRFTDRASVDAVLARMAAVRAKKEAAKARKKVRTESELLATAVARSQNAPIPPVMRKLGELTERFDKLEQRVEYLISLWEPRKDA